MTSKIEQAVSDAESGLTAARADLEAAQRAHAEAAQEYDARFAEMVAQPSDKILSAVERADTRRHRTELAERAATERVARAEKALAIAKGRRTVASANALREQAREIERAIAERVRGIADAERVLFDAVEFILAESVRAGELFQQADELAPDNTAARSPEDWLGACQVIIMQRRERDERQPVEDFEPSRWLEPMQSPLWNDHTEPAERARAAITKFAQESE